MAPGEKKFLAHALLDFLHQHHGLRDDRLLVAFIDGPSRDLYRRHVIQANLLYFTLCICPLHEIDEPPGFLVPLRVDHVVKIATDEGRHVARAAIALRP